MGSPAIPVKPQIEITGPVEGQQVAGQRGLRKAQAIRQRRGIGQVALAMT